MQRGYSPLTNMGEQPIFSTKAHVFHIDPNTKKNWIPSSTGSVNVSFYYDSNRSTYRIISVDGSKAIINSTLVPNMTFTKTSQKFGQWSDARANTVYGLGFSSESELNKFAEKFGEVRDLTKQQLAPPQSPQSQPVNPTVQMVNKINADGVDAAKMGQPALITAQNSEYMTPMLDRRPGGGTNPPPVTDGNGQLKYENDRLKIALAQSSQNAKKWEVELQTLKNNNARLTAALQESTTNVDEWKKQLAAYKEDNARLKKMVIEFEQSQPNQQQEMSNMQQEMTSLMDKLSIAEGEKLSSQRELEDLRFRAGQVSRLEEINQKQETEVQELRSAKRDLEDKLKVAMADADAARRAQSGDKSEMARIHDLISCNVSELSSVQSQMARLINS